MVQRSTTEPPPASSLLLPVSLGVGQARAQVAGELLADGEAEAVAVLPIGALVQGEWGGPALWGDHTANAALLGLRTDGVNVLEGVCEFLLCGVEGGGAGDALQVHACA